MTNTSSTGLAEPVRPRSRAALPLPSPTGSAGSAARPEQPPLRPSTTTGTRPLLERRTPRQMAGGSARPSTSGSARLPSRKDLVSSPIRTLTDLEATQRPHTVATGSARTSGRGSARDKSAIYGPNGDVALNAYSRPLHSKLAPLRSGLLDPTINNFPRSKTQSEFLQKKRLANMPHESYDIDGDGYVSQEDYYLAKRFDLDGNGVLDDGEKHHGREIMADEFLREHEDDIHLYGEGWSDDRQQNVDNLAASHTFQAVMSKLKETEKNFKNMGSTGAAACLKLPGKLTTHNYYVDKFDTTAWNDFGANPRRFDPFATATEAKVHGSRQKMYHLRKVNLRDSCQHKLTVADERKVKFSNRRIALITNWSVENG